ncbi:MAG: YetF domain-containing protein [Alkaliphilus sp.]
MWIMFIRTVIVYVFVVFVIRIMGKRQIAQLQPFELVITVMIAEMATIPIEQLEIPLLKGVMPIVSLLLMHSLVSYTTLKSEYARGAICGKPSIVIDKGKIVQAEIKKLQINMNDLLEQLRCNDYHNIGDIEYAIFETNGEISIIPKKGKRSVECLDLGLEVKQEVIPITIILDGKLNKDNLKKAGRSEEWLKRQLKKENINRVEDVFFGYINTLEEFCIQKY